MEKMVTVIVPVYNVKNYLEACIKSIVKQSYSNMEIILVDDGSTDGSEELCDIAAKNDSRIHVIHKQNGGLSSARNKGIEVCSGDYVCFIDSDDQIHPDYVKKLIYMCEKNQCKIAACSYRGDSKWSVNDKESKVSIRSYRDLLKRFYSDEEHILITVAWNKLYSREVIGNIRYPEGIIHEDEYTTFKYIYAAKKIAWTDEELYCYTRRENSIMQSTFSLKRLDGLGAYEERWSFYKNHGEEEFAIREEYCYLSALLNYYASVKKYLPEEKAQQRKLLRRYRITYKRFDKSRWEVKRRVFYIIAQYWPDIYTRIKSIHWKRDML